MTTLARGNYCYWHNGELQAVTEPWQLLRSDDGLLLSGQRIVNGKVMLDIEARYLGGLCTELRLNWNPDDPTQQRSARYHRRSETLEWSEAGKDHALHLSADCMLFPLLRAATGPLLHTLAISPRSVVVPCIRDPADTLLFLQPLLSQRRAIALNSETDQGEHFLYLGGEYSDSGCECWLNPQGLLQRYRWTSAQSDWDVRMTGLVTAPGFSGFS